MSQPMPWVMFCDTQWRAVSTRFGAIREPLQAPSGFNKNTTASWAPGASSVTPPMIGSDEVLVGSVELLEPQPVEHKMKSEAPSQPVVRFMGPSAV